MTYPSAGFRAMIQASKEKRKKTERRRPKMDGLIPILVIALVVIVIGLFNLKRQNK